MSERHDHLFHNTDRRNLVVPTPPTKIGMQFTEALQPWCPLRRPYLICCQIYKHLYKLDSLPRCMYSARILVSHCFIEP